MKSEVKYLVRYGKGHYYTIFDEEADARIEFQEQAKEYIHVQLFRAELTVIEQVP